VVLIAIMLGTGEGISWYWLLLVPAVLLQTMFNTGAALAVSRMAGAVQDIGELIPFLLRVGRYFCGVMYMVTLLPAHVPLWAQKVLSLNPFAAFISLVRVALMHTYRDNAPGNAPYNAAKCAYFHADPGRADNSLAHLQAYCHAVVTNNDLWMAAVGWGVVILAAGLVFFWQAEHKYGRG